MTTAIKPMATDHKGGEKDINVQEREPVRAYFFQRLILAEDKSVDRMPVAFAGFNLLYHDDETDTDFLK